MSRPKGIQRRLEINITDALRRRFWNRVQQGSKDDCWPWKAAMRNGYGAIKHDSRVHSSHRLAYILTNGLPSDEHVIAHTCDNRECCNPSHLEAIPAGQNNRDARARIHHHVNCGEDAPNAVLTDDLVRQIISARRKTGFGARKLSRQMGIGVHLIRSVIEGRSWKHITGGKIEVNR